MKLLGMETQISAGDRGKCACQQAVSIGPLALLWFVRSSGTYNTFGEAHLLDGKLTVLPAS
jgi:hypothetical protein